MAKRRKWLTAQRAGAAANVGFFSEPGRPDRERAQVAEFLRYLGVPFTTDDLRLPPQDHDVDVRFGEACFQNLELMDPGRRRHDEVRAFAEQVRAGNFETPRPPESVPMSMTELMARVVAALGAKKRARLSRRAHLDALVYVNLHDRHLDPVPAVLHDVTAAGRLGWRSVSALWPPLAIVFCAAATAPAFLREHAGRAVRYHGYPWEHRKP